MDQIFPASQNRDETIFGEISFGDVMVNTRSSKKISIRNPYPIPLRMKIENFSSEVIFDKGDEDIVLPPFSEKSITCSIIAHHTTQEQIRVNLTLHFSKHLQFPLAVCYHPKKADVRIKSVSYTHLTLPTILLV